MMMTAQMQLLIAALEALPAGMLVLDTAGCVVHANERAARWDHDPPRELVGHPLPEDFPGWLGAGNAAALRRAVAARLAIQFCERSAALGLQLDSYVIPAEGAVLVWVCEASRAASTDVAPAPRSPEARRATHDLMQRIGAISNYAELIRLQSTGDVKMHAAEISRLAAALAATLRQQANRGAPPADQTAS